MAQTPIPKNQDKKRFILILSSYGYGDEWSTSIAKDIRNRVESACPEIGVVITYAGIGDRNSFLSDRYAMQGAFASGKLSRHIAVPDVLILIGDESWMMYRIMNHRGVWEKVPVVLCGVHSNILEDYSRFFPDKNVPDSLMVPLEKTWNNLSVTGVMIENNSSQTIRMIETFLPRLNKIAFLSKGNYQDKLAFKYLSSSLHETHPQISLTEVVCFKNNTDSVRQILKSFPKEQSALVTNMASIPSDVDLPVFTLRDVVYQDYNPVGGNFVALQHYGSEAADAALRIYGGTPADSIPFVIVSGLAKPYLNRKGLEHFHISHGTGSLFGTVDRNLPLPFWVRNVRPLGIGLLVLTVLFFAGLIYRRSLRYRRRLVGSFERYKGLYDEYQTIYENMPVGLLLIDMEGNLMNHNVSADQFLRCYFSPEDRDYNIFHSNFLDDVTKAKIQSEELVSTVLTIADAYFRVIFRPITDEDSGKDKVLVIVIDITDIRTARNAKEKIYKALNFAMDASSLGVAEYNLLSGKGFATNAWYENLAVEQKNEDFNTYHAHIHPEDARKIQHFFEQAAEGKETLFLDTIRVQCPHSGEVHWIRYLIQVMDYAPEKSRIIMAGLTFNIDEQMQREAELTKALKMAREADRLKNAFVANMKNEIRIPLDEIITCSVLLIETAHPEEKQLLNVRIEKANRTMLKLIQQIIDCSREESDI